MADGADLIHNSWGGTPTTPIEDDPLVQAYEAAVDAGIIVVFSAGNAGPGQYTISSPAVGRKFISVAASTTDRIFPQILNVTGPSDPPTVTVPITLTNIPAVPGSGPAITQTLAAPFKFVPTNALGCSAFSPGTFTQQVAVVRRGVCTFATKVTNAYNAGAIGVVVVNNVGGFPIAMGGLEASRIPAVMVTQADGENIINWYMTYSATYTATLEILPNLRRYTDPTEVDKIASFSSRGPNLDDTIKPDVTAPGVNILSAVLDGFALYQGTSMSAPHVSGAAALLRQLNPTWTPAQIKSALMTTADYPANLISTCGTQGPMCYGAGRINLVRAGDPGLTFDPPSLSFGVRMAGSGPVTLTVTARNVTSAEATYIITPTFLKSHSAISVTVVPNQFTVTPAGAVSFDVVLNVGSLTVSGYDDFFGYIEVSDGAHRNRLPFWVRVIPVLPEAEVLLVDADFSTAGFPNYAAIYTTTLNNLGISYYYLNASTGNSMLLTTSYVNWLRRYPLAIVFTGDNYLGFGTLSTFLRAYLAAGGRVLLTGQDIGYFYGAETIFPLVTGARYVQDSLYGAGGPPRPTAAGDNLYSGFLAGRIYDFSFGGNGANNQWAVDEVAAQFYVDVDAYPILSTA
ncbi:MAG: S8 family serine peptidase, partial [Anaerolineae bacterium]|nr:S8 family serine peptidase [Anaerolineae bacterium]